MGTNRLRFQIFGPVVGADSTGPLSAFPLFGLLCWAGLGWGRAGCQRGSSGGTWLRASAIPSERLATKLNPMLRLWHSVANLGPAAESARRTRVDHPLGVVTRTMPHPHPGGQRPDSRVQHLYQVRNLIRRGAASPQPSSERLPSPVRETVQGMMRL